MPFFYEDRAFTLFIECASGKTMHSCLVFEMYIATAVLEARLAKELNLDSVLPGGLNDLLADVDPDGTAALRFFPSKGLGSDVNSKLKLATDFRQALSKMVSLVDEEIKEMKQMARGA
jgi:hypothetical protein